MNFKQTIITFIIMLTIIAILFYLAPLDYQQDFAGSNNATVQDNNDAIELQKDREAIAQELKTQKIREFINNQY